MNTIQNTKPPFSKPKIYECDSSSEQYKAIIDIIKKRDLTDVGILFPSNKEVKDALKSDQREAATTFYGQRAQQTIDFDQKASSAVWHTY